MNNKNILLRVNYFQLKTELTLLQARKVLINLSIVGTLQFVAPFVSCLICMDVWHIALSMIYQALCKLNCLL